MKVEDVAALLGAAGYDNVKEFGKQVRNETIDEVAAELEKFCWVFGGDTVDSFVKFVKGLKE